MQAATLNPPQSPCSAVISVLNGIDRIVGIICRSVVLATGVALLVSIGTGVVARYVINVGGIHWAEELPKQLFTWFIMAGVVLALQSGSHIAVPETRVIRRSITGPPSKLSARKSAWSKV